MASKGRFESLTEEVVCPICLDFFTDPVSLECGHYFCRSCITQSWDSEGIYSCPECRVKFTDRTLRVSWALARLSEKARKLSLNRTEKESKLYCEEHEEELKLFCETDKKLICVVCAAGREHESHSFMPVKEAVETYKDQVKSSIQSLTKNKLEIQRMEQQQIQNIFGVLEQSHDLQSKITYQFAELHQILTEKEQHTLADIQEEEKKILNTMETNLGMIEIKKKSIQEEAGRKRRVRDEANPLSVIDEALPIEKFHCPASFKTVFSETSDDFKRVSVTLDVETANPELEVSEDRKRVRQNGTWMHLREDNGKRFMSSPCVLGSEGFTSGRHYWEAHLRGFYGWTLGVAAESVERKGWVNRRPTAGVWSIRRSGELFEAFTSPATSLPVRPIPYRVGVYLNYESGTVSFYDADTKSHLHTFNGYKFTEKLYPFFWVRGGNWMTVGSGSAPRV